MCVCLFVYLYVCVWSEILVIVCMWSVGGCGCYTHIIMCMFYVSEHELSPLSMLVYMCVLVYVFVCVPMSVCVPGDTYVCVYVECVCPCAYTYIHIYMCMHTNMLVWCCVCLYIIVLILCMGYVCMVNIGYSLCVCFVWYSCTGV